MKIIFMGTPDFAVPSLRALAGEKRHEVCLVVTQPDRPKGRSRALQPPAVKQCALELGIPVYQPEKVRSQEAISRLREEEADIIVVAAFGQILPKELLEMPRYGCINLHGSLLPEYRGASPIQQAVIDGKKEAGNTVMQMAEGLDSGDILMQESIPLAEDETAGSLFDKLSQRGGPLLLRALDAIEAGLITPIPQDESKATHVKMLRKEMGDLDWTQPAQRLSCQVRGFNPWPGAYTHWNGKLLKIWMAKTVEEPGRTAPAGREGFRIQSETEAAPAGVCEAASAAVSEGATLSAVPAPGTVVCGDSAEKSRRTATPAPGTVVCGDSAEKSRRAAVPAPGTVVCGDSAEKSRRTAAPAPGTVVEAGGDRLIVQTGDGLLALTEVQLEGRKRMPAGAFLLGCRIRPGDTLIHYNDSSC